jgi:hypothetical protein
VKRWDWTVVGEVAAGIVVAGLLLGLLARAAR